MRKKKKTGVAPKALHLRDEIMKYVNSGEYSKLEIAKHYNISVPTLYRIIKNDY